MLHSLIPAISLYFSSPSTLINVLVLRAMQTLQFSAGRLSIKDRLLSIIYKHPVFSKRMQACEFIFMSIYDKINIYDNLLLYLLITCYL